MRDRLICAFLFVAGMMFFAGPVHARAAEDSTLGYPVCALPGSQILQQVITHPSPGESGPVWPTPVALWEDMRDTTSNNVDLYIAELGYRGSWPASGTSVATGPAYQWHAREAVTGNWGWNPPLWNPSGVLVAWQQDLGITHQVRARRVLSHGSTWPDTGVVLTENAPDVSTVRVVGDIHGGGIVAWIDRRSGPPHIYAQRLDEGGAPLWTPGGKKAVTGGGYELSFEMTPRGADGAYLTWINVVLDEGFVRVDLRATSIQADGTQDPAWPVDGVRLTPQWIDENHVTRYSAFESQGLSAFYDSQGLVVAWGEKASLSDTGLVRAQYLTPGGVPVAGWPAGGLVMVSGAPGAALSFLASLDRGLLIGAWADQRRQSGANPYVTDVYAQRVSLSGAIAPGWPASGLPVSINDHANQPTSLFVTSQDDMMFFWDDQASPTTPYAQCLGPDGFVSRWWPGSPVLLCSAPGAQSGVLAVSNDVAGAYFAWTDQRDYATLGFDVYENTINGTGTLEVPIGFSSGLALSTAWPNPTRDAVHFSMSLARPTYVSAAIFDIAGRCERMLDSSAQPAGRFTFDWDGRDDSGRRVPPGVHFLRVNAGPQSVVRRFVVLR